MVRGPSCALLPNNLPRKISMTAQYHDSVTLNFHAVNWLRLTIALALSLLNADIALAQTSYARADWDTHMTPMGHGVKGTATILDSRTIVLTHFSYDGAA